MKPALYDRFTWEADGIDSYHILSASGPVKGDCDDYAVTVIYEDCGRSMSRFIRTLWKGEAKMFLVDAPNGERHVVAWIKGKGCTDNITPDWYPSRAESQHTNWRQISFLTIWAKLTVGLVT